MTDKEKIRELYKKMYSAMIRKDRAELERVHDDSFVLVHMTGMKQNKDIYINCIMNGTLNYFSEKTASLDITVSGDTAHMTGKSVVSAAVFGGGRYTWRLALAFDLIKVDGEWKLAYSSASTY